jgi:hypothetical protein
MRHRLAKPFAVAVLGASLSIVPAVVGISVAAARSRCKVLKASEVAAILDTPVKPGRPPVAPAGTHPCSFVPKDSSLHVSVNVWVDAQSGGRTAFSIAKDTFKADIEPSPELGKKSFYVGNGLNTAYVLRGDTLIYLQYIDFNGDPTDIKSKVLDLMKVALKHT